MLKIEVTQDDIQKGVRCSAGKCPVARAAERATGLDCSVSSFKLTVFSSGYWTEYRLPPIVSQWIDDFDYPSDDGVVPGPITFECEEIE